MPGGAVCSPGYFDMEDEKIIKPRGSEQLMPKIAPPEHGEDIGDTKELWKAMLEVQKELEPFDPLGKMEMGYGDEKKTAFYVKKDQIVSKIQELLIKNGLLCTFESVKRIDWVKQYIIYWNHKGGKQERPNIHLRYWCEYSFRHVESEAVIFRVAPGDVMGYDSKHSTIAMAFALRDCLAQVFLVSAKQDIFSLEEMQYFQADGAATKTRIDDIHADLKSRAQRMIQCLGMGPMQKQAKTVGFKPSTWEIDDMKIEDYAGIIEIGTDMINPGSEKEALKNVGSE